MWYKSQLSPLQFLGRKASEIFYYIFSFALIYKFYPLFSTCTFYEYSLVARMGKKSPCKVADLGLIPGLRRSPGGGHGNPLQYSCLENPMDRGAWWAAVHGIIKSRTQPTDREQHSTCLLTKKCYINNCNNYK